LARIATFGDGRDVPPRSGEAGRDTEAGRRRETVGDTDRMDAGAASDVHLETMETGTHTDSGTAETGVSEQKSYEWGNTRKEYWRIAHSQVSGG